MKINRSLLALGVLLTVILIFSCSDASRLCNGVSYDKNIYRCEYGELIGKCKGKDYYVAYDQCINGIVVNDIVSSSKSGTFTDSRDGKIYQLVKIGTLIWMAENLNYDANGSKCYNNDPVYCDKSGRLYDWETAKVVCPEGWHLPSDTEWNVLTKMVKKGSDVYGFSLPDSLHGDNSYSWWRSSKNLSVSSAFPWGLTFIVGYVNDDWTVPEKDVLFNDESRLNSVRCLQDLP